MEDVRNWLRGLGLGQYAPKFEELGWDTLEIVQYMSPDEIKECIDKPGHRRKFELGLKDRFPSLAVSVDEASNFKVGTIDETSSIGTEPANFQDLGLECKLSSVITSQKTNEDRNDSGTLNKLVEPCVAADNLTIDSESGSDKDEAAVGTAGAEERVKRVEETIYVKGASNKILKSGLGRQSKKELKEDEVMLKSICGRSMSRGVLTVKNNLQILDTLHREDIEQQTDDDSSSSVSEEDDTSALSKIDEIEIERHMLLRRSTRPVTRTTVVKDSKNVTVAKKAKVIHIYEQEKNKPTKNFKEQISNVVKSYQAKAHLFVETRAFQEVKEILDDSNWALIAGKPGDGKSAMAAHLLLQYKEKTFEPVIVTNIQDWKSMVKGSDDLDKAGSQFVMIDDMFGSMSVDNRKVNEWVSMLDIMQRVVKERKGKLKVICTSRTYVFKDVKSKIERFTCLQESKIVDLTFDKHALTPDEKMQIWTNYTNEHNVSSSPPSCIFNPVISPHGFPHCVELFCSNQFLRQGGLSFFENPMKYVCREIQNFKDNDKIKYCLLLLILFKNNRLEMNYLQEVVLSDPPKDVIKIFKAAGVSTDHAQSELKKAVISLKNTYICETLDGIQFSHESIRENVAFMCIKDSPLHAIEDINFRYLVDHTRCYGFPSSVPESVFVLPAFCTNALVERTVREIKVGQIYPVCQHQAWTDHLFIEKWTAYILEASTSSEESAKEEAGYFTELFCKRNTYCTIISTFLTFIESLLYFGHEQALLHLLSHGEIVNRFNSDQMKQMLCHALVFACLISSSENVVIKLIEAGADVNFVMPNTELTSFFCFGTYDIIFKLNSLAEKCSPILCSVFNENRSLLKLLILHGGRIFTDGEPAALIFAVLYGFTCIVEELAQTVSVWNLPSESECTRLHQCIDENKSCHSVWNSSFTGYVHFLSADCALSFIHVAKDKAIINILLQNGARINKDVHVLGRRMSHCMFRLLTSEKIDTYQELLQAGMKVTGIWNGYSSLHFLIPYLKLNNGDFSFDTISDSQKAYLTEPEGFLSKFISNYLENNSIHATDGYCRTPLHYFLQMGPQMLGIELEVVQKACKQLLCHGANINRPDVNGVTPGMVALKYCNDAKIVLKCMEKRTPKLVDENGRGYFHYLAESNLPIDNFSEIVDLLLETGEEINLQDDKGNVPVFDCHSISLAIFNSKGASLDHVNRDGQNVIAYNLQRMDSNTGPEIVERFKDIMPKYNTADAAGRTLMHFLMLSSTDAFPIFKHIFELLLSLNCSPETPDKHGMTPLMLAVENTSFSKGFFSFFLEKGLNVFATDADNLSVLHHCIKSKRAARAKLKIVRILLTNTRDLDKIGRNVLSYAVFQTSCSFNVIQELLKCRTNSCPDDSELVIGLLSSKRCPSEKMTCLISLVVYEHVQINVRDIMRSNQIKTDIKALALNTLILKEIIKPNEITFDMDRPLDIVTRLDDDIALCVLKENHETSSFKSILSDKNLYRIMCKANLINCLTFILKLSIQIDQQDESGNTLYHIAIGNINNDVSLVEVLKLLIKRKLSVYLPNKEMKTPLHLACKKSPLQPQAIYLLMTNMTSIDQVDSLGMTALQYICLNGYQTFYQFDVPLYLAFCLMSKGADVDLQNNRGQTSIMLAAQYHPLHKDLLSVLIKNSNNVNISDASGNTVLHYILRTAVQDTVKASVINDLLRQGADVTAKNKNSETCLCILQDLLVHKSVGLHVFETSMSIGIIGSVNGTLGMMFKHLAVNDTDNPRCLQIMKDVIINTEIDVNARRDSDACTLLMIACKRLLPETTLMLLSMKADPNVADMIGRTCLTNLLTSIALTRMSVLYACYTGGDLQNETALHLLSSLWNPVDSANLRKFVDESELRYPTRSEICYTIISDINNSALNILQTLLSYEADPNVADISGKTALHYFVQSPITDFFVCPAMKMLLDSGANVNCKDLEGMTPLMACSLFPGRKSKRMRILIAAGATILETDNFGCDAVEYGKMAFGNIKDLYKN